MLLRVLDRALELLSDESLVERRQALLTIDLQQLLEHVARPLASAEQDERLVKERMVPRALRDRLAVLELVPGAGVGLLAEPNDQLVQLGREFGERLGAVLVPVHPAGRVQRACADQVAVRARGDPVLGELHLQRRLPSRRPEVQVSAARAANRDRRRRGRKPGPLEQRSELPVRLGQDEPARAGDDSRVPPPRAALEVGGGRVLVLGDRLRALPGIGAAARAGFGGGALDPVRPGEGEPEPAGDPAALLEQLVRTGVVHQNGTSSSGAALGSDSTP
jgi:hypothetical protein